MFAVSFVYFYIEMTNKAWEGYMMANEEHVAIFRQGPRRWNEWREQHRSIQPDLSYVVLNYNDLHSIDLSDAILSRADLHGSDLSGAILSRADLNHAHLGNIDLNYAYLNSADLHDADLRNASLKGADLHDANLHRIYLSGANLRGADLRDADLSSADLSSADLAGVRLNGTDLRRAHVWDTIFAQIDLRLVKGLTELNHQGPSRVELYTIQLPQDGSALHFLRGCGVPEEWIDDYRVRMMHPIQYHSCFISYSSEDNLLARRLHADLQIHGVRCWFAPEDMKIGNKIRERIDEAIHLQDKLLLLLSEHAIASTWVENEVESALEKEDRQQREVLFPVRLDDAIMQTSRAWAATLRRTRHIGDFTRWAEPEAYQRAFERLLRDLKKSE